MNLLTQGGASLYEKYRPKTLDQVVGQDKAIKKINAITSRGWGGRAWWISGKSGCGKTTLARIIAGMGSSDWDTVEIDASELTADRLRELKTQLQAVGMGSQGGRAIIVNEAHGLRADTIRRLLVLLESIPGHAIWVFTTTNDGQESLFEDHIDAHPLLSRCIEIGLEVPRREFATLAKTIAESEGLDGKPEAAYLRLIDKKTGTNMRRILQAIEAGEMME